MQKPALLQKHPAEFPIDEGCFITELSNSKQDADLSIARARVPVGVTTEWHHLRDTVERYLILQGKGCVEIGDLPATEVGPDDVVLIPANCRQRIANTGDNDLLFLVFCTPRFRPACYQTG
jgi:mannose-6-phosphate isomerase-like protein (cupin superfamily)